MQCLVAVCSLLCERTKTKCDSCHLLCFLTERNETLIKHLCLSESQRSGSATERSSIVTLLNTTRFLPSRTSPCLALNKARGTLSLSTQSAMRLMALRTASFSPRVSQKFGTIRSSFHAFASNRACVHPRHKTSNLGRVLFLPEVKFFSELKENKYLATHTWFYIPCSTEFLSARYRYRTSKF